MDSQTNKDLVDENNTPLANLETMASEIDIEGFNELKLQENNENDADNYYDDSPEKLCELATKLLAMDEEFNDSEGSLEKLTKLFASLSSCLKKKYHNLKNPIKITSLFQDAILTLDLCYDFSDSQFYIKRHVECITNKNQFAKRTLHEVCPLLKLIKVGDPSFLALYRFEYKTGESYELYFEYGIGTLEHLLDFVIFLRVINQDMILQFKEKLGNQLSVLHKNKLVHLDIKPANIILSREYDIKFSNYYCGELLKKEGKQSIKVKGTEAFMLPEMLAAFKEGEEFCQIDPFQADKYSFDKSFEIIEELLKAERADISLNDFILRFSHYNKLKIINSEILTEPVLTLAHDFRKEQEEKLSALSEEEISTRLLYNETLGSIYQIELKFEQSTEKFKLSLELSTQLYGPTHPITCNIHFMLGTIYDLRGDHALAQESYEAALQISIKDCQGFIAKVLLGFGLSFLSQGKPDQAISKFYKALENVEVDGNRQRKSDVHLEIGLAHHALGQYKDAITHLEKCLEIRKDLKPDDVEVADCLNSLGSVYFSLGLNKKAHDLFKTALEIYQQVIKPANPQISRVYNNMGAASLTMGHIKKAYGYLEKARSLGLASYPENHPEIALIYNNLGLYFKSEAKFEKSMTHFQKALSIFKSFYGEEHPEIANVYCNMGSLFLTFQQLEPSLEGFEKALAIRTKVLHPNHPDIASLLINKGIILKTQKKYQEALETLKNAQTILTNLNGDDDQTVLDCKFNIANILILLGQGADALHLLNSLLSSYLKHNSEDTTENPNLDIAMVHHNLAIVHHSSGNLAAAKDFYLKAVKSMQVLLGEDHANLGEAYYNLGRLYHGEKEYQVAMSYYKKAKKILYSMYGDHNTIISNIYNNMAKVNEAEGEKNDAVTCYLKALTVYKKVYKDVDHVDVSICYFSIASIGFKSGKFEDALYYYQRALLVRERLGHEDYAEMEKIQCAIASCHYKMKNYVETLETLNKAYKLSKLAHKNADFEDVGREYRKFINQVIMDMVADSDRWKGCLLYLLLKEIYMPSDV